MDYTILNPQNHGLNNYGHTEEYVYNYTNEKMKNHTFGIIDNLLYFLSFFEPIKLFFDIKSKKLEKRNEHNSEAISTIEDRLKTNGIEKRTVDEYNVFSIDTEDKKEINITMDKFNDSLYKDLGFKIDYNRL